MASPINPNQNTNPADTSSASTGGNSSAHLPPEDKKASDAAAPLKPNPEKTTNINQSLKTLGASGKVRPGDEHTYLAYLPKDIRENIDKKAQHLKLQEYFGQIGLHINMLSTGEKRAVYDPERGITRVYDRLPNEMLMTPQAGFYFLVAMEKSRNSDLNEGKGLVDQIKEKRLFTQILTVAGDDSYKPNYAKFHLFSKEPTVKNILNLEILLKAGLSFNDYHKSFPDRPRQPLKPNDPEIELIKSRIFALTKLKSMVETDEGKNSLKATIDVAHDKIEAWFPLHYEKEFAQEFLFTNDLNILIEQYTSLLPKSQQKNSNDSKYQQDYTYQNMYNKIEEKFK